METTLGIIFVYLWGNKEIYSRHAVQNFPQNTISFVIVIYLSWNNIHVFIKHALLFKYQPGHLKVNHYNHACVCYMHQIHTLLPTVMQSD